mgnify:FL=1
MKYPKIKETYFTKCSNSLQINVNIGRKYKYWWIEPNNFPIKTLLTEIPNVLNGIKLTKL